MTDLETMRLALDDYCRDVMETLNYIGNDQTLLEERLTNAVQAYLFHRRNPS